MAGGVTGLRRMQLGKETTKGTEAAATAIWRGPAAGWTDAREVEHVEEHVGIGGGTNRTYTKFVQGTLSMPESVATFEQLPYVFNASIKGVTGSRDSTGSGYIYIYPFATNAAATLYTYTIETGDNQEEEQALYCFVESFKISGAPKEGVMVSSEWVGRQVATGAFTALTHGDLTTVEEMQFGKSSLYLDTAGGTAGTTQISSALLGFDFSASNCAKAVFTGDGQLYFTFEQALFPDYEMDVTFEYDSSGVAAVEAFRDETAQQLRLQVAGTALTTTSAYTTKTLIIDMAGHWVSFESLGELDGDDTVTGKFVAKFDETADTAGQIIVVNQLAALE